MSHVEETILSHHLTALENNERNEIVKDYTESSVVLTPNGKIHGLEDIYKFFELILT